MASVLEHKVKKKLGKVLDYAVDPESMKVQKIYASQSLVKSLTGGSLSIDRDQIVEITNKEIVVQDAAVRVEKPLPIFNTQPAN